MNSLICIPSGGTFELLDTKKAIFKTFFPMNLLGLLEIRISIGEKGIFRESQILGEICFQILHYRLKKYFIFNLH